VKWRERGRAKNCESQKEKITPTALTRRKLQPIPTSIYTPLTTTLGRLFPLPMLQYSLERYVLALIQSKVMCSGARGEKFEHAMLGKLDLPPTSNDSSSRYSDYIAIRILDGTIADNRHGMIYSGPSSTMRVVSLHTWPGPRLHSHWMWFAALATITLHTNDYLDHARRSTWLRGSTVPITLD
jgi:hypothetical protein